jgi:hypothetical protein
VKLRFGGATVAETARICDIGAMGYMALFPIELLQEIAWHRRISKHHGFSLPDSFHMPPRDGSNIDP